MVLRTNDQIDSAQHFATIYGSGFGVGKCDDTERLERQHQQPMRIERRPFDRYRGAIFQLKSSRNIYEPGQVLVKFGVGDLPVIVDDGKIRWI